MLNIVSHGEIIPHNLQRPMTQSFVLCDLSAQEAGIFWAGRLRIKDLYLDLVLGRDPDAGRYRNYPTYYRANTPVQIAHLAGAFRSCQFVNFSRLGQWSSYLPGLLRPLAEHVDRRAIQQARPGTLLIVRATK